MRRAQTGPGKDFLRRQGDAEIQGLLTLSEWQRLALLETGKCDSSGRIANIMCSPLEVPVKFHVNSHVNFM